MSELWTHFTHPPADFSPAPFWWWSGERLDLTRLLWELERFAEGGIYNVIILDLAPVGPVAGCDPDDPPLFSETWWQLFRQVCARARELGISIWLYDQLGFPSYTVVPDRLVKWPHPEYAAQTLERVVQETTGSLTLRCPTGGTPLAAAALPLTADGQPAGGPLPLALTGDSVVWTGTGTGGHRVMLFYTVEQGFDYFNQQACQALLQAIHGEFEKQVGEFFGTTIVGSFQDELPPLPLWSRAFAERFRQLHGYDLLSHLAALWEDYGDESARVRRDYHETRARLAEVALFQPLFTWYEQRGLIYGFDQCTPVREGQPIGSVRYYANYLRTHRWYSAPGSDHYGEGKIHASLAHLYQRPRVWIEAFHSTGWGGTLEETYDWLLPWLRAGANLYNPHAVYYSFHGGWWEWAPPSTDWRQPYWKHYPHFARTVSRLCAVLTLGHHVCDVGVLYPTTTVQSDLRMEGAGPIAQQAHNVYLQLTGKMLWSEMRPGILTRLCRDYDVLDDDSLQRGSLADGQLVIGDERYAIIVLPACHMLEEQTVHKLVEFARDGGKLVAFGALPALSTAGSSQHLDELLDLFARGTAMHVRTEDELRTVLAQVPPPIEAPVPALVRKIEGTTIVFVSAAFTRATGTTSEEGGAIHAWNDIDYVFDRSRYRSSLHLKIRDVRGTPYRCDPYSGQVRPIEYTPTADGMEVDVTFEDGPGALLVWSEEDLSEQVQIVPASSGKQVISQETLDDLWQVELVPTLDNRWGDFALPVTDSAVPLTCWQFRHAVETPGRAGLEQGWQQPDFDDTGWSVAHATFGPHGLWIGPRSPAELPQPGMPAGDGEWYPAVYSLSRGIYKDPAHRATLGPKGHVPEEFLHFGFVREGEAVQFRASVHSATAQDCFLALGAAASKEIWLNGQSLPEQDGYLLIVPVHLQAGENRLEFRLVAARDGDLRAHYAFITDPAVYQRAEWLRAGGQWQHNAVLVFSKRFSLDFMPESATLQAGANVPYRVRINGVEVSRYDGWAYPDTNPHYVCLLPCSIASALRQGENLVEMEVIEFFEESIVIVDGRITTATRELTILSDGSWDVTRNGVPVPLRLYRHASIDLWRRPHPLPATNWLETSAPAHSDTVLPLVPVTPSPTTTVEWLRFVVPPGARKMALSLHGSVTIFLDGDEIFTGPAQGHGEAQQLRADLPHPERARRVCALRVETVPGFQGGAILEAAPSFECGPGMLPLGDWQEHGLHAYSGGLTYTKTFSLENAGEPLWLDLGNVRGTAEVTVNGQAVGVRTWSPYRFDLTRVVQVGENMLQITVYNTLAPYIDAISPTHYVFANQKSSGLFGPIHLIKYAGKGE